VVERKPREIAFATLERSLERKGHAEDLLAAQLPALAPLDRALCHELVLGVIRWQATLDWVLEPRLQKHPPRPPVRILLRLGIYQLLWLDRIPAHAAVNETVELARRLGHGNETGFINAVLRGVARERDSLRTQLQALRETDLATAYSHPLWLCDRWIQRWGTADGRRLLEWNNTPAELYARVNTLRADPGKVLERWRMDENVGYDFFLRDWTGENLVFRLKSHPPMERWESLRAGWFYLQDPSTLLAVDLLNPQPGDQILDSCAAPGGKTSYIAQRLNNQGLILARDSSPERLDRLRENCARLGVTCVETERVSSRSIPPAGTPARFDRALVDAPCSNTGVMRRRVELRWRVEAAELERLAALQLQLVRAAAAQLRPGGVLVYSTCSLEPEENEGVVRRVLAEHPEFQLEQERQLWPFRDGVDGAYAARLVKVR
jgi:16S rRNA (cytosine967-C5)-methyltransferase